ncbi:MAG: hypothetical protein QOE84_2216 [Actinomycetota bacterium]|nr:hypothetical protein [Actinomycetota bacterium]
MPVHRPIPAARRSTRWAARPGFAATTAGCLLLLATATGTASAATAPAAQTAPPAGQSTTVTWDGTITAPASPPSANCPAQAISDSTDVTINVPSGLYDTAATRADFSITWDDPLVVNDEKITVVPPPGGGDTKSADEINDSAAGQHEQVSYDNPVGGVWTVRACAFSSTPQSYTGKLVLTSTSLDSGPTPTPTATATASTSATTGSNRVFGPPVIVDSDDLDSVAEPSLEVTGDGTVYVTGPQGSGGARIPAVAPGTGAVPGVGGDLIWRSRPDGTFQFLGSYDGTLGGGDADVVAAPGGTLYASGLSGSCITTASSSDKGDSWLANPAGCADGAGVADRQWNDVDGDLAVYTGYGTLSRGLVLHKSLLAGQAGIVNGPATVVDNNNGDYQWPGVVDVDQKTGDAVMAWNTTDDKIEINGVHRDGSLLFATPKLVANAGGDTFDSFVAIDHGTDGTLYAVWTERHPAVGETWTVLAASRDGGTTWGTPVHVDSTPSTTVFPWVTAGDDGRVAVSYYGTDSTGPSPEKLDTKNAPWHVYSAFSTDHGATFAEDLTAPDAIHRGSICTSGTGCATGTRDLLDFFETDIDPTGCLVTAYTDNSRDVVAADGSRTTDNATHIGVVRQVGGDGLLSTKLCGGAAVPVLPEAPLATLLPMLAAAFIGLAVYRRRRLAVA